MSRKVSAIAPPPLPDSAPQPLVSVIIPTRNRAHLLLRSVNSVLAQTYRNFELIVVDDASDDSTAKVLEAIDDLRLRVIRREKNRGAAAARNAALALAQGALIAFHDDDDIWLPDKLAKQVAAMTASPDSTALCLCGRLFVQSPGHHVRYMGGPKMIAALAFTGGNGIGGPDYSLIATPGWLVRRAALDKVGHFDERMRSWDDWELGLRLWLEYDFVVVDEPLYIQDHVAGGGLMRMERARADDLVFIDEKHGYLWAHDRNVLARHAYTRGIALSLFDPRPAGRAELWQAMRLRPLALKAWVAWLLTFVSSQRGKTIATRLRAVLAWTWRLRHP